MTNLNRYIVPLSLLLLTLSGCPNQQQENNKSKDIPKEKSALEITVRVSKNNYPERIEGVFSSVINPLENGLEKQIADSEEALKKAISDGVKSIVESYTQNDSGTYTVEIETVYPTGRKTFMIDDFELGKE
jgi:hypothetical protein